MERELVETAARLRERCEPFVVATVLRVRGSAYRQPGARMLISHEGWLAGSVSGGCLEGDLLRRAWWLTENGPAVVTYDSSVSDDDDPDEIRTAFGIGCGGIVDVLLERSTTLDTSGFDPFELVGRWYAQQRRGAISTTFVPGGPQPGRVVRRIGVVVPTTPLTLVETIVPPPRLFIFGTGHDAVPLVRFARTLGWETFVCARVARPDLCDRFCEADAILVGDVEDRVDASDRAVAVVMSHHVDTDRDHLAMLLGTRATYIGVLGAATRTHCILRELGIAHEPRLHAPVGLAIGAETPEAIALAIASEIQSTLAEVPTTRSLRDRVGPIHPRAMHVAAR